VAQAALSGSPYAEAAAHMLLGVFLTVDDPRGALAASLRAAQLADRAGVRALQGIALANAAESAVDLGDWDVADRALAEAAAIGSLEGYEADGCLLTRCMLLAHRGRHDEARRLLDGLLEHRWEAWFAQQMNTWFLRVSALCYLLAGDDHGAADEAWRMLDDFEYDSNTAGCLWLVGAAGAGLRDADLIERLLGRSLPVTGPWAERAFAVLRAAVEAVKGNSGEAREALDALLDEWLAADLPLDHAVAALIAARALPVALQPADHVARARAYLDGLGGVALLALLDDAAPARPEAPTESSSQASS
jgi:hypothetical protein